MQIYLPTQWTKYDAGKVVNIKKSFSEITLSYVVQLMYM